MTGSPEHYKGQYASLKFAPYKYQEYPKLVYPEGQPSRMVNNALEEKEYWASLGIEKSDIDPLAQAQSELETLRAKLAQYEGSDPKVQLAAKAGVATATVEMLPAEAAEVKPPVTPPAPAAGTKPNPLLAQHAGGNNLVADKAGAAK